MIAKRQGRLTIAANGRNHFVIRGTLQAAQRANAAVIIEIRQVRGRSKFPTVAVTSWSICERKPMRFLQRASNHRAGGPSMGDHYGIKSEKDLKTAMVGKIPLPCLNAGNTSIAIDASHLPDRIQNSPRQPRHLNPYIPQVGGL